MRTITSLALALLLPGAALAKGSAAEPATHYELNTYRQASTIASLRGSTPEACSAACSADAMCAAWTLTPATFRIGPRCELKRAPGRTTPRPGAISGLSEALLNAPQARVPEAAAPADETPELAGGVEEPVPTAAAPPAPAEPAAPPAPQPVAATVAPTPVPAEAVPAPAAVEPPRPAVQPAPAPAPSPETPAPDAPPTPQPASAEASGTMIAPPPMSPNPTTGTDTRPALPLRKQQEPVPSYSVQRMDVLPGDYEGTGGLYAPAMPEGDEAPETDAS